MENSAKQCQCGCGQQTKTGRSGQSNLFLHGHNSTRRPPGPGWLDQGRYFLSVNGRTIARARVVMQELLGRDLRSDEIVHHLDENPLNDSPENLQIVSRADHLRLHRPRQSAQQWSARDLGTAAMLYLIDGMNISQVALALDKSYAATRRRLKRLAITRQPGPQTISQSSSEK